MAFSVYIFIISFGLIALLVLRKALELRRGRMGILGRFFDRIDSLILRYSKSTARFLRSVKLFFTDDVLGHIGEFLVTHSAKATEHVRRRFSVHAAPVARMLRGKRILEREPGSLYVRSMLEYKSRLGRE